MAARHAVAARCEGARASTLGGGGDALGLCRSSHAHADGYPVAATPTKGRLRFDRGDVAADVARIHSVWSECLAQGGPMLFGSFSIADAFYAPVVTRFATYGVKLSPLLAAYSESVLALPADAAVDRSGQSGT